MRDPVFQTSNGRQAHNAGPCHAPGGVAKSKLAVAVLLALTAALALTTAPAFAARGHVFSKEFGSPGSLPGQLKEPSGVAVNESTGNIYVVDKGNNRVEVFNAAGTKVEGEFNGSGTLPGEEKEAGSGGLPGEVKTGRFSFPSAAEEAEHPLLRGAESSGIAVDDSCFLHKTPTQETECREADPSAGDVYVVDAGHKVVDKFTAAGVYIGQITGAGAGRFEELKGVSVDSAGSVWIFASAFGGGPGMFDGFTDGVANEFVPEKSQVVAVQQGLEPVFAVDSADNFYVSQNGVLRKYDAKGQRLIEAVDQEPPSGVAVELSSSDVYIDNLSSVGRFAPEGSEIERLAVPGAHGSGIAVNSGSETVYVADSSAGVLDVYVREPATVPSVAGESVSEVSAESASFTAQVDPRSEPGEPATAYVFEYGPCSSPTACASSPYTSSLPVPAGTLAADFEAHAVGVHVQGLLANTVYHFRVATGNAHGAAENVEERTFTTQTAGGELVLPDGRQWEKVSEPRGTGLEAIGEKDLIQASASGDALTYVAISPTEPQPQGDTNGVQVLSTRRSPSSWSSLDLTTPHEAATGIVLGFTEESPFFSKDLSLSVTQPYGVLDHAISEEASEQTAFLRTDFPAGHPGQLCTPPAMRCYMPLVTAAAGHANVPAGTVFGEEPACASEVQGVRQPICGPRFVDATPDASHVILTSPVVLTPGTGPLPGAKNLYEWAAGKLTFIGIGELGVQNRSERHAVSDDGSRVIFKGSSEGHEGLLMRDMTTGTTIQLDAPEAGCVPCGTGGGQFQLASNTGMRVLFTDTQKLTGDSGAVSGTSQVADLYECAVSESPGALECSLRDLTPKGAGGESADVRGVIGASEDGSSVYFAANGVLSETADSTGEKAHPASCGQKSLASALCNLYVEHAGVTRLIAVLSSQDGPDWTGGGEEENLNKLTARVSPNGEWLAFMSERSLTGYDNRDAATGRADEEVFLYHATGGGVTVCASCNPTGARPSGVEYRQIGNVQGGLAGGNSVWPNTTGIAANVPGWTPHALNSALYQSRYLSDSGRLFFNSSDALVPQDVNGTEDVYQYEPAGVPAGDHACNPSSSTFSERSGGCVSLISSGTSSSQSAFVDASETGNDVFFLTSSRLTSQDHDTLLDVYDAHVCTSESPCATPSALPPPCTTESSCKPPPTPQPQIFGAPSSATFSGPGNTFGEPPSPPRKPTAAQLRAKKLAAALASCRKRYKHAKKKRAGCEKTARHKYAPLKKKK
jgi:DNA-binding beta-propeller fold protein YncE